MARKKTYEVRFPTTEAGWEELGERVTNPKTGATPGVAPKVSEIRREAAATKKHRARADAFRRRSREEEELERKARARQENLLRRRAQGIKSRLGVEEAKAALQAEGYDVVESTAGSPVTQPAGS